MDLSQLPPEVLGHVLAYLRSPFELCNVSLVCRALAVASRDDSLWQPLGHESWRGEHVAGEEGWKGAYLKWLRAACAQYRSDVEPVAFRARVVPPEVADHDYLMKILILGKRHTPVGKSSLLLRYADETFVEDHHATIGVDFKIKRLEWHGLRLKLQIWDAPTGSERSRPTPISYYRGAHVILLVYDITDRSTFEEGLSEFWEESQKYAMYNVCVLLVGTKSDLEDERQVSREEAAEQARVWGIPYYECSAKTGEGVEAVFQRAVAMAAGGWRSVAGMATPTFVPEESLLASLIPLLPQQGRSKSRAKKHCCLQ